MSDLVIDLFAGAGGWDQGFRDAGYDGRIVGLEWDDAACRTAAAAGHPRIRTDVTTYPKGVFGPVDGLLASPPCQAWSRTGSRRGLADPRGELIVQPERWIAALRPRWFVCEITPDALCWWGRLASRFRRSGYSVWYGLLDAAHYGTPSNRRRAICIGRSDGRAAPPRARRTAMTMADALGWDGAVMRSNYNAGGKAGTVRERGRRGMDLPAFTMTGKCNRNAWEFPDGTSRPVTLAEAGVLNGFPVDYPWTGNVHQRAMQVGNSVAPPLAAAVAGVVLPRRAPIVVRRRSADLALF